MNNQLWYFFVNIFMLNNFYVEQQDFLDRFKELSRLVTTFTKHN